MNPVGITGHAQGGDASRPLMSADAIEHTPRLGPLPEVRVELDTPSNASISRPAPAALIEGSGETSTGNGNGSGSGTAYESRGNPAAGGEGWSPEQDARMKDILSASVQAAIAQGESEGATIGPPRQTAASSSPSSSDPNNNKATTQTNGGGAEKVAETIEEDEDAMETVDLSDTNNKGKGKGKAKAEEPQSSVTGLGVLMGTADGADAVDQLLGEWTTLRRQQ